MPSHKYILHFRSCQKKLNLIYFNFFFLLVWDSCPHSFLLIEMMVRNSGAQYSIGSIVLFRALLIEVYCFSLFLHEIFLLKKIWIFYGYDINSLFCESHTLRVTAFIACIKKLPL